MRINRREQARPHAVDTLLLIRYMLRRPRVAILLGQAKVNDVNQVRGFAGAHDEVGGLDVAVEE